MAVRFLIALYLMLAVSGASGQTTPATPETPPDEKAYNEAGKIADPAKKIAALEKLKKDFPDSSYISTATSQILDTLVQKLPEQTGRIRKAAKTSYAGAVAKDKAASRKNKIATTANRGSRASRIADQLAAGGVLLKDAERYAHKGVDALNETAWMAEERASYTREKMNPPSREALAKDFAETRASRIGVLGRVELKLGRTAEARRLLEESYAVTPSDVKVSAALGELAIQAGDDAKAMDYLISARLTGRAPETANQAFETLYKKSHAGTLDGLEAMLDAEYYKRFPNPIHVEAYKPTEKRSARMVLAEVFTGSGCGPCAGADAAFDAALERYSRQDLAVVMYHAHIPRPDPMATTETMARYESYGKTGVPGYAIDGKKTGGGGSRDMAQWVFDRFQKDLEADLEMPPEAHILRLSASGDRGMVRVSVTVDIAKSDSKDLKVQILLVEKKIRYLGENGIRFHPMVVRAFGGEKGGGYAMEAKRRGDFDATFDLEAIGKDIGKQLDEYEAKGHRGEPFKFSAKKDRIDRGNLAVVVFVQDDTTKHVLQAGWADLSSSAGGRPGTEASQ
jgi:hypothetical protein